MHGGLARRHLLGVALVLVLGARKGYGLEVIGLNIGDGAGSDKIHVGVSCGDPEIRTWDECRAGVRSGRMPETMNSLDQCAAVCATECYQTCNYVTYNEQTKQCSWFAECDLSDSPPDVASTSSMLSPCACSQDGTSGGAMTGRPGCAEHTNADLFCYVVDPSKCTGAIKSAAPTGAAWKLCNLSSSESRSGGVCKMVGCGWTYYQEGIDWGWFSRSYTDLRTCKMHCLRTPGCTGIEWPVDGQYCAFWNGGACNVSHGYNNLAYHERSLDYVTCTFEEHEHIQDGAPAPAVLAPTPASSPMPGLTARPPGNCPGCASVLFQCNRPNSPTSTCAERNRSYAFDFTYRHDPNSCFEQIPHSGSEMQFDFDLWCLYPSSRFVLSCENMMDYDFGGVSMLRGCSGGVGADDLVRETCAWTCKYRRPVARCSWEFDHTSRYGLAGGLQACWLWESCQNNSLTVPVVCQPQPGIIASSIAARQSAEQELSEAISRLDAAWDELQKERLDHNSTQQDLTNAWLLYEGATQRAAEILAELKAPGIALQPNASKLTDLELEAYQQSAAQQLATALAGIRAASAAHNETLNELERTRLSLEVAISSQDAALEALERERSAHSDTKGALDSESEGRNTDRIGLGIMMGVLICVIGCFSVLAAVLYKRRGANPLRQFPGNGGPGADVEIVLGRPVAAESDGMPEKPSPLTNLEPLSSKPATGTPAPGSPTVGSPTAWG